MAETLEIRDLRVNVQDTEILKGVTLTINQGEIHALMGPNGSGKSTLAYALTGHPGYQVMGGEVIYRGQNILALPADERSKLGLFLAFQYPVSVPGVSVANFLRTAINARRKSAGNGSSKPHLDPRVPQALARKDEDAQRGRSLCRALPQRRLFRR